MNYLKENIIVGLFIACGGCLILLAFAADWIGLSKHGFGHHKQFALATLGYYAILMGIYLQWFRGYLTKEYLLKLIQKNRTDILLIFVLFSVGVAIATSYVISIQENGANRLFYPPTGIVELPHQLTWIQPLFPHGILFGLTSALAYGIFRVGGIGRVLSVIGCVGFMTSSMHLYNLVPSPLRDYAKAPFILAVILFNVVMIVLPLKQRDIINLSLLIGFFLGIGSLVRQDLLIFILLPMISVVLFLPSPLCKDIKLKGIVLVILILMVIPQLLIFQGGGKGPARVIGGLMSQMDELLGISRPVYDYGHLVRDQLIWTYPYAQAKIREPGKTFNFAYESAERGEVQRNFLRKIVLNFPADMLTRGYAALLQVLELPFTYLLHPLGIKNSAIMAAYSVRAAILDILSGTSIFLVVIALLIISARSLRLAFLALYLILFLGCYPVLQFFGRHYFHLQFITWWAIGFVVQHAVLIAFWFTHRLRSRELKENLAQCSLIDLQSIRLRRILIFGLSSIIILFTPLLGLRYYQNIHLNELLQQYKQLDLELLAFTTEVFANGNILFSIPVNYGKYRSNNVDVDYIVADFNCEYSRHNTIWPILRYQRNPDHSPGLDFSRLIKIDINQSNTPNNRLIFPIFAATFEDDVRRDKIFTTRFAGIEMSPSEASCMEKVYRIKEASKLPLLLTIIPGKPDVLYQRLNQEISSIYTVPSRLEANLLEKILHANISPLRLSDVDFKSDIVNFTVNKWDIRGYAAYPCKDDTDKMINLCQAEKQLAKTAFAVDYPTDVNTDLVWTKKIKQIKGNYFMVRGELYAGGVTFGLVKDDRTAGAITITRRGPFTVIIEVPEDGFYSVGMANELNWFTSLENRFIIHRIGWVGLKTISNIAIGAR